MGALERPIPNTVPRPVLGLLLGERGRLGALPHRTGRVVRIAYGVDVETADGVGIGRRHGATSEPPGVPDVVRNHDPTGSIRGERSIGGRTTGRPTLDPATSRPYARPIAGL